MQVGRVGGMDDDQIIEAIAEPLQWGWGKERKCNGIPGTKGIPGTPYLFAGPTSDRVLV